MNESTPTPVPTLAEQYDHWAPVVLELHGEFVSKTVSDLEYAYKRVDSYRSISNTMTTNIESVKNYLIENYEELGTHADEIATLLDIELSSEVEYSVSMTVTVTVTVAPGDDAESLISRNLYVESNDGNISVDDYEVDYVNES